MSTKRIIDLTEQTTIAADAFVMTDNSTSGTYKYNLKTVYDRIVHYAACSTAAATAAKAVSVTGFSLVTGACVIVRFANGNTAATPTLDVGGTGAKQIRYNGAALPAADYIITGGVYTLVYDGTYWELTGFVDDGTVSTGDIENGAVTAAKLNANVLSTAQVDALF